MIVNERVHLIIIFYKRKSRLHYTTTNIQRNHLKTSEPAIDCKSFSVLEIVTITAKTIWKTIKEEIG